MSDDTEFMNESQLEEIKKTDFRRALFISSRCAWGFTGGMVLLMFINENLYLESQMFPYAAKICCIAGLLLAALFDACYLHLIEGKSV